MLILSKKNGNLARCWLLAAAGYFSTSRYLAYAFVLLLLLAFRSLLSGRRIFCSSFLFLFRVLFFRFFEGLEGISF